MRFMQIESVLQTKNRSEPAKNRFSVALASNICFSRHLANKFKMSKFAKGYNSGKIDEA